MMDLTVLALNLGPVLGLVAILAHCARLAGAIAPGPRS